MGDGPDSGLPHVLVHGIRTYVSVHSFVHSIKKKVFASVRTTTKMKLDMFAKLEFPFEIEH